MYRITILAALFVLAARSFASPLIEARQVHNLVFDTPQRKPCPFLRMPNDMTNA